MKKKPKAKVSKRTKPKKEGASLSKKLKSPPSPLPEPIEEDPTVFKKDEVELPKGKSCVKVRKSIEVAKKCDKCQLKERLEKSDGKEWIRIYLQPCKEHATKIFRINSGHY